MNITQLHVFAVEFLQSLEPRVADCSLSPLEAAKAVIADARRDRSRRLGFSRADIEAIRARVTPGEQAGADEQFAAARESDLFMPFHNNAFAARYALKVDELCRRNAIDIGDRARPLITRVARSLIKLLAPDAQYPGFADAVVGRYYPGFSDYLRYDLANEIYFRRLAALYGLGDLKYVIENLTREGDLHRTVWGYLGDLQDSFDSLQAVPPEGLDQCHLENGLYAMRDTWSADANYLAIQAGPGGTAEKSHKQSDIFNFELYSHGDRVIVDNWYGPAAEMSADRNPRMWRISTDAHNTVSVDGQDQLQVLSEFRYGNVVLPLVQEWESTPDTSYFHGVHDAYCRLRPDPVAGHRRKIFFLRNRLWVVIDRLIPGTGAAHDYALLFNLKPEAEIRADSRVVTTSAGGNVLLLPWCNHGLNLGLRDNPYPWEGYENPRQLRCESRGSGPVIFVTLIVPFRGSNVPDVAITHHPVHADDRILNPWEATALTAQVDRLTLDYLDLHTHWTLPWQAGSLTGSTRRQYRTHTEEK